MLNKLQMRVLTKPKRRAIELWAVAFTTMGYAVQPFAAQEPAKVIVPLQISSPYQQSITVARVEFDQDGSNTTAKTKIGSVRLGKLPGGLRVAVETILESPNAYRVRVGTNGNNDLSAESSVLIELNSSVTMNVTRTRANGKTAILSYTLSYGRSTNGQPAEEMFYWRPDYAAEGKLKIGNCRAEVKVLDANGDGVFDRRDFRSATTIYIDDGKAGAVINLNDPRVIKHSDGSIEIPGELRRSTKRKWLNGNEIIEICGTSYVVEQVEPDGSALTLAKTDLRIPKLREELPHFTMTTLDGRVIDTT